MKPHIDEVALSQLADGELRGEAFGEALAAVLDDADAREALRAHLRLRSALAPWRTRQPARAVSGVRAPRAKRRPVLLRVASLAAAAVIGGAIVAGGFLAAVAGRQGGEPDQPGPGLAVTADQMAEMASVFRLHESVAGPLRWYAADEDQVRLASADQPVPAGRPVGVVLRLAPVGGRGGPAKTYFVVCRDEQPAAVEWDSFGEGVAKVRLWLLPTQRGGKVRLQYAVALSAPADSLGPAAVLGGRQPVGVKGTSLGRVVFDGREFEVAASAWVIQNESTQ